MSDAIQKRISAGTQFSWLAVVSPFISVVSLILLVTVAPIGSSEATRTETSDGGYMVSYDSGLAASMTFNLAWLFLILAVVAGILTFILRSGRQRMNLIRASIGLLLVVGIVAHLISNQS